MPTYAYHCDRCGTFERLRSISERDAAIPCPLCEGAAARVISGAPGLALAGASHGGAASASGQAPAGRYPRMRHAGSCACCR